MTQLNLGTEETTKEAKKAKAREKQLVKLLRERDMAKARADRDKALVREAQARRRSLMRVGDWEIELDAAETAKVIAVAGLTIIGVIAAAYLVKVGLEYLLKLVMSDGSVIETDVSPAIG